MIRFRKVAALGLAALMTVGSLSIPQAAGASGLPTTQGHDKYVNKNVFDIISSDTFGMLYPPNITPPIIPTAIIISVIPKIGYILPIILSIGMRVAKI